LEAGSNPDVAQLKAAVSSRRAAIKLGPSLASADCADRELRRNRLFHTPDVDTKPHSEKNTADGAGVAIDLLHSREKFKIPSYKKKSDGEA